MDVTVVIDIKPKEFLIRADINASLQQQLREREEFDPTVRVVAQGKYIEITLNGVRSKKAALKRAGEMCEALLVHPVTEEIYSIEILPKNRKR